MIKPYPAQADGRYREHFLKPDGLPTDAGIDLARAGEDFREFLNYWHFLDQQTGEDKILGHVLWEAQEEFVRKTAEHDWIFFLKARKLGETTIECAYDGWVLRFRDKNARVHLFSRRDDAAQELLNAVKYGIARLPQEWQLPIGKNTTHEFELVAGPEDRRLAKAYPADKETAVEATCTHGHVDEWARMGNPRKVWQAIEATMAKTCHFVTTGLGPANFTSTFWRRCMSGDAPHYPCFIGALNRPDRNPAWLAAKRAGMDAQDAKHEYPMTWEDALSGGGEFIFRAAELDDAGEDFRGLMTAEQGRKLRAQPRKYVKAWDIGRHKDAAVGIVLDVTDDVHDVVAYQRLRNTSYPDIQHAIKEMHLSYPGGITAIEKNSAGEAVLENLDLPRHVLEGFSTNGQSKPRIISQLRIALQNQLIKWDPLACSQLDSEMRGYQLPDDDVVQDSVITLAIALEYAGKAHLMQGRVTGIIEV